MQPEKQSQGPLNYFITPKGNILWGAALTLAWKQLAKNIIKEQIKIRENDPKAQQIVRKFNKSKVSIKDLSPKCYYVKSGYGNQTIRIINKEVAQKFKDKTTPPLKECLPNDGIISYAYFLKNMKFNHPFTKKKVLFGGQKVQGFCGANLHQKQQIIVHKYSSQDSFTIELLTKSEDDRIFIIKTKKEYEPQELIEAKIPKKNSVGRPLVKQDIFQMPKISIHQNHDVKELIGKYLTNKNFEQYFFDKVFEIVKLDIDQTGVKVENEGVIMMRKCAIMKPRQQPKKILINNPFWIIMMERNRENPYFMAYVKTISEK